MSDALTDRLDHLAACLDQEGRDVEAALVRYAIAGQVRLEGTARRALDNELCWVNECARRAAGDIHVVLRRAAMPDLRVAFAACSDHIGQFERVHQDPGYVQHWDIGHVWRADSSAKATP